MHFHYDIDERLPRLAWCAAVRRGADTVSVRAGGWVETHPEWFAEGAWNGRFAAGAIDEATVVAGTGARVRNGRVLFVSGTDLVVSLYHLRRDDTLFVSNSMVFVLAQAADRLAPDYLYHAHDALRFFRNGPTGRQLRALPTELGARLHVHTHGILGVDSDLGVEPIEHPEPPVPQALGAYVELLQSSVDAVVRNGGDTGRRRPLVPLMTVSRGYDSGAVAVLARNAGCREAVTLRDERLPATDYDDGSPIAERLGLRCVVCDAHAYERLIDIELEFHAGPLASGLPQAVLEPHLAGRLLLTGEPGWDTLRRKFVGRLQRPAAEWATTLSVREFRLRVGYAVFPVVYVGAIHRQAISAILQSDALQPYSVGGRYDAPFPRYLLETAGVPRSMFGMVKMHSAGRMVGRVATYSEAARNDFRRFRRAVLRRIPLTTLLGFVARRTLLRAGVRWNRLAAASLSRLEVPLGRYQGTRWRWSLHYYLAYQWSADRLRHRYRS